MRIFWTRWRTSSVASRGLGRQCLDFAGHDREALAGFARACGLDRGVEGEQVGLAGDGLDLVRDAADPLGCLGEVFGALSGLGDRLEQAAKHGVR